MKTCKQLAIEWGLTERNINYLCKAGKINGAIKVGRSWQIPDDATKPVDGRLSSGKYVKKVSREGMKSLPIGISDYVRAQADYYYVDKTLLIKEFLDRKPLVSLFTRPRRFGKTLNMDMLRVFFEISEEDEVGREVIDENSIRSFYIENMLNSEETILKYIMNCIKNIQCS